MRNNNPGNLRYGDFAIRHGAIGEVGGFAVFADQGVGYNALYSLFTGPSYNGLSVNAAIAQYAPTNENNVAAYQAFIDANTSFDMNRTVYDLSPLEVETLVEAIGKFEGGHEPTQIGQFHCP